MIYKKIKQYANQFPDKTAVVSGREVINYKRLLLETNRIVDWIECISDSPSQPIGSLFPNSIEAILVLLACEASGHPCVLFSMNMSETEILHRASILGLKHIFFQKGLGSVPISKEINFRERRLYYAQLYITEPSLLEKQDFICQFTSGTNQAVKAAVRTKEGVYHEIEELKEIFEVRSEDVFLTLPPICHSYGLIGGTLLPLYSGATVIFMEDFRPRDALKIILKEQVSILFAVPFMYQLFVDTHTSHLSFHTLRICCSAGEFMSQDLSTQVETLLGQPVVQDYGSTETGTISINRNPQDYPNSVGRPLENHNIMILDATEHNPIPLEKEGEIWIKGDMVARAYLYPLEMNKTSFLNGAYFTGDMGWMDKNGYLYISGRKSRFINIAGLKVDPREIEDVIKKMPEIREVLITAETGKATQMIKAIVVKKQDIDANHIVSHCKKYLPYHKIPRIINFVEALPQNSMGKIIDRNESETQC